jgi:hypothetical protein
MISVVLAIVYLIVYLFSCRKDSGRLGQPCPQPAIVSVQHFHHFAVCLWVDVSYAVMSGRITSAPCSTCGQTIQVQLDGKVKIHGPQVNRFSGSGKLPRIAAAPILIPSHQTPSSTSSQLAPTPTDVNHTSLYFQSRQFRWEDSEKNPTCFPIANCSEANIYSECYYGQELMTLTLGSALFFSPEDISLDPRGVVTDETWPQ